MDERKISVSLELTGKCKSSVKKNIQSNLMGIIKYVLPLQVYKVAVNVDNKSWFIFRRYNEFHQLHEKVSITFGGHSGSIVHSLFIIIIGTKPAPFRIH